MSFLLGTHQPAWLARTRVPLVVSHRRLTGRRNLPRARGTWALDSGGFTELALHGTWQTTPRQYATAVRRYATEIGTLAWAAQQDWMCEPHMLARTGLSIAEHHRRTVANYQELRQIAPDLPFLPVLQGWAPEDYLRAADAFESAGVDLAALPLVGVGSICRRTSVTEIVAVLTRLHARGLRLHGFGVKTRGLAAAGHLLASADSLAWSLRGRYVPGCAPTHTTEANCLSFALTWRSRLIDRLPADARLERGECA